MKKIIVLVWLSIPAMSGILSADDLNQHDTHPPDNILPSPPGHAPGSMEPDPPTASPDLDTAGSEDPIISTTPQAPAIDDPPVSDTPFEPGPIPGTGGLLDNQEPTPDYESWETANGIAGAGAASDSDGDGIPNGIEFVIGGDPSGTDSDSNSLLPTVIIDPDFMYFIFRRTEVAAGYNPTVEYSSTLAQWTSAEPGVDGVFIEETEDFFEPGVARVSVRIPRSLASGSTLLARIRVDITP
jgi:hypothetical protein